MEPLWSPAPATNGKHQQIRPTAETAKTSQNRYDRLQPVADRSAW
jgi:hypothetical protein